MKNLTWREKSSLKNKHYNFETNLDPTHKVQNFSFLEIF